MDFDTWLAEAVCLAAAERAAEKHAVRALVLPAVPFGPTPEHRGFGSGYIDVPQPVHEALIAAVLASLAEQGFRRLVVWRGCGQHDLSRPVGRFNAEFEGRARAFQPGMPYAAVWQRLGDPAVPGGHADSFATSLALHLRPAAVRTARLSVPQQSPVDWDDPRLDLSHHTTTGVIGDPTHASVELGARLWAAVVAEVAVLLQAIAAAPLR